ncbi:unnamed protein product, partial [marine sediment metagenome]
SNPAALPVDYNVQVPALAFARKHGGCEIIKSTIYQGTGRGKKDTGLIPDG